MKIYLIGMPGSGKSTLGKQLASALDLPFFDLDKEIEKREGRAIPEIFAQSGEEHFRLVESAILREFAGNVDSFVLATGGGAPCFFENMEVLNASGITVYLKVTISTLIHRLRHSKDRPLLNSDADLETRLTALLGSRQPVYERSIITVSDPDVKKITDAIQRTDVNK